MAFVDTKDLPPHRVLMALYDYARAQGMGFMHHKPGPLSEDEAKDLMNVDRKLRRVYFDYLHGRVMKVDLTEPKGFDAYLYDRDNGQGAAQAVVNRLWDELTMPEAAR